MESKSGLDIECKAREKSPTKEPNENPCPDNGAKTKLLEARTAQAEARVEQAETRREQAEMRSEQAIRESELSYRRLFEAARDGILILDAETAEIRDVNPFLTELLGFSRDDMIGKTFADLSPFKGMESTKIFLGRLKEQGYVRYEKLPLETKAGRQLTVEFVSNVYKAGQHQVVQCSIRDITERTRIAAELAASALKIDHLKSALQEGMASFRLAAIVESSHDAIIGKDLNNTVTSWNKGAEKIFGYTASEMVGASIMRLVPLERQDEENQILETIKRGETIDHFETKRQTKDGRLVDFSVSVSPIRDSTGQVIGVAKVSRDISERKVSEEVKRLNAGLERKAVERTAELEMANQELEAFSYSVSHDLRAPLRHIVGFVSLLQKNAGPSLSPTSLSNLKTISQAATRMGKLIDDLLAFSRVGRTAVQKTEVCLDELVRETLADFEVETREKKIMWHLHDLPMVWADRALLQMVLMNLISNAVKFTGASADPKIEIAPASHGKGEIVIFVRDNGAGFDPQYAGKLFGVFQRLHSREEFEGTGIGLANVRSIIQRHGGRVWAEGAVGLGATFYFTLPIQNKDANGH